jgi:hypothetical protein
MKAAALAPAAVGGLLTSGAAETPSLDPVHQAYPVMYGPPVSCFFDQGKCGCGWSDHKATGPLALKGSFFGMTRPPQAPAPHPSKQR